MPLILSNADVEQLLTMENCMDALEYAYGELGHDRAVMGPVIAVISPVMAGQTHKDGRQLYYAYSSMAAALPGRDVAANRQDSDLLDYEPTATGVRLVRIPASPGERFCGLILLHKVSTGELLAVIHDGFMQKTRVGGLAGVAAKYRAQGRRGSRCHRFRLAGVRAGRGALSGAAFDPRGRVFSPSAKRREAFAAEMADKVAAKVVAVPRGEAAVRGAAIVATATNSIEPVLFEQWIEPGMFITSVKELEFEDSIYARCDLLTESPRPDVVALRRRRRPDHSQTRPRNLESLAARAMAVGAHARPRHRRPRARADQRRSSHRVHEPGRGYAIRRGRRHALRPRPQTRPRHAGAGGVVSSG